MKKIQKFRDLAWWIRTNADLNSEVKIEISILETLGESYTTTKISGKNLDGELIECELINVRNTDFGKQNKTNFDE